MDFALETDEKWLKSDKIGIIWKTWKVVAKKTGHTRKNSLNSLYTA